MFSRSGYFLFWDRYYTNGRCSLHFDLCVPQRDSFPSFPFRMHALNYMSNTGTCKPDYFKSHKTITHVWLIENLCMWLRINIHIKQLHTNIFACLSSKALKTGRSTIRSNCQTACAIKLRANNSVYSNEQRFLSHSRQIFLQKVTKLSTNQVPEYLKLESAITYL